MPLPPARLLHETDAIKLRRSDWRLLKLKHCSVAWNHRRRGTPTQRARTRIGFDDVLMSGNAREIQGDADARARRVHQFQRDSSEGRAFAEVAGIVDCSQND